MKRIGILTGGGDAPGLNTVIRAVVLTAHNRYGWDVIGIQEGFDGLLAGLPIVEFDAHKTRDLLSRGGTVLGAANRGSPFHRPITHADGTTEYIDVSHEALERMAALHLDALIVAGGDGTISIAHRLVGLGGKIVGVPKTIDNDLAETDITFGFDTALQTATEALDRLQTTAESHHRVMVLEVMGRNAGWIALTAGVAGGADAILIPEIPFDINVVCAKINAIRSAGRRRYSLVVVAEGARMVDGEQTYAIKDTAETYKRLGGVGYNVGNMLKDCVEAEVRVTVLGHVQRGGSPTPRDRWLATQFGTTAVELVSQEQWGTMVALQGERTIPVPMADAIKMKFVDPQGELVQRARSLGIVFG
jgi:ATP-dependent phosphofructokinase / diphosphate-dependent phosphofructokinase